MKYLIVGLGNVGLEYMNTRHNVGFEVVNHFAQSHKGVFMPDRYADLCQISIKGRKVFLIKPNTYMNLSGKAVRYHMEKNNIDIENILIVTDDKDIPLGTLRLRSQGSGGTHNGMNHIIETLNTSYFSRLRIGIGSDFNKGRQVEYVLGKFLPEELETLKPCIALSKEVIESFIFQGIQKTMNLYNTKNKEQKAAEE